MAHPAGGQRKKPLWLIEPCLDASQYRDRLIGSVVRHPDIPTEAHIPYKSTRLARDMVPGLDPKPVQVRNVRFWQRRIKDAAVSASLNDIVEAFVERARNDGQQRAATVARMWHMDSPAEKFKELLRDREYLDELFELLRASPDQTAYFITDMVTLVNLEVSDEHGATTGAGAGVTVPLADVSLAPGVALGLRAHAGGHAHVQREQGYSATYDDETIVFLGYRLVRLEKVAGTRARVSRALFGDKRGLTIRDGLEYWPQVVERPVEGNVENFMAVATPRNEEQRQLGDEDEDGGEIVEALGFDVEIFG